MLRVVEVDVIPGRVLCFHLSSQQGSVLARCVIALSPDVLVFLTAGLVHPAARSLLRLHIFDKRSSQNFFFPRTYLCERQSYMEREETETSNY